jgi:predicted enzyme related to lactoylglutathione lyase
MTDDSVRGRFIWHELMTPNPAGARDFYSTALGWKAEGAEDSSRSTFLASSGPLGGCAEQSPTEAPRWIPFVTVVSADDSFREAVELGADAVVEPTAIEDGGRYAVLTDPQGAAIGVYSADDFGEDRDPNPGEFSWHELATTDARAAFDFYTALFGWELVREHDMGPMGAYLIVGYDGKQLGGIFNKDSAGMSGAPAWLSYVRVRDLSGTIEKVTAARGSVLTGPMEVPGGDWVAQLLDPHGAAFALHAVAADAKAEASHAKRAQEEASQALPSQEEAVKAQPAKKEDTPRVDTRPAAGAVTEIWSATGAGVEEAETTKGSARKSAKKKPSTAKAAKSKTSKKKASTTKKAGAKKPATRKAAGETATKKAAKKSGKKKASAKKAAKKTAKTKQKTAKKAAAKKAAAKKAGKKKATTKKSGKKAAGKKAGKTAGSSSRKKSGKTQKANKTRGPGSRKKSSKTAGAGSRKKSGTTSAGRAGAKKAGKKKAGKKSRKKSGRR